jgi:MFS family permease
MRGAHLDGRLWLTIIGNALMRIASGASGVLVGLYLADLADHGFRVNAALVGTLGAVSFASELAAGVPMGVASDALAPRALMTAGVLLGAIATQLFGISSQPHIFFLSRTIEGLGAASVTPSLLAHLTDATDRNHSLRARVMSYFELSLLAGLALGGVVGAQLWRRLHTRAFAAVASVYLASGGMLFWGAAGSRGHGRAQALHGFLRALREPSLLRLTPAWICVNSIVGLWLGPTLIFLLTRHSATGQFLDGLFSDHPERVGWLLLGYSMIFATGVTGWSFVLPRITEKRALRIALLAMLAVCIGLYTLNHSGEHGLSLRWTVTSLTTLSVMVESGFTPAALSLLAGSMGAIAGRGAAMGIYSVLLSVGAILGSLLAAALGQRFAVDGLIYGTFAMALVSLWSVSWLRTNQTLVGAVSE